VYRWKSNSKTAGNRPEPLARQYHSRPADQEHSRDDAIRQKLKEGKSGEALFFELAIEDLRQAADLFRPTHDLTNGVNGWVSLEGSPLLAHDTHALSPPRSHVTKYHPFTFQGRGLPNSKTYTLEVDTGSRGQCYIFGLFEDSRLSAGQFPEAVSPLKTSGNVNYFFAEAFFRRSAHRHLRQPPPVCRAQVHFRA
jgi:hypothetical protein